MKYRFSVCVCVCVCVYIYKVEFSLEEAMKAYRGVRV
jgi:hypothetical protein